MNNLFLWMMSCVSSMCSSLLWYRSRIPGTLNLRIPKFPRWSKLARELAIMCLLSNWVLWWSVDRCPSMTMTRDHRFLNHRLAEFPNLRISEPFTQISAGPDHVVKTVVWYYDCGSFHPHMCSHCTNVVSRCKLIGTPGMKVGLYIVDMFASSCYFYDPHE